MTDSNRKHIADSRELSREALYKSQEAPSIIEGKLPETPKRPPKK